MKRIVDILRYIAITLVVVLLGLNITISYDGPSSKKIKTINSANAKADFIYCIPYNMKCAETTSGDTVLGIKTDIIIF